LGAETKHSLGELPGLELINDRFGTNLQLALERLLRVEPVVSVAKLSHEKLSDFLSKTTSPLSAVTLALDPLPGAGLLVIEPQLIYAIVDMLFGGKGHQSNPPGHIFSATETSIATRLIDIISEQYRLAWASISALNLSARTAYSQAQFVDFVEPREMLMVTRLSINLGEVNGDLFLCLPLASLQPVLLSSGPRSEQSAAPTDWFEKMSQQLAGAPIELVANLTEIETTVHGLLNLKVGQVLDCIIDPCLVVRVEGVAILSGHYGIHQGHYALRVQRLFSDQNSTSDF
jgi:flagellar motor switch protein FliM